jgi:hypothetical protein
MDFKEWLMAEMPITKFDLQGNWKPKDRFYGYDRKSIGILTNPKAVEKIHKRWSNSKENFELYFVRKPGVKDFLETGEVDEQWVKEKLGLDIKPAEDTITIIFTNNIGDEKVPMTAWVLAHRMAHAIRSQHEFMSHFAKEINTMVNDIVSIINNRNTTAIKYPKGMIQPIHIAYAIGAMKSARDSNLRTFSEFTYELVAQYITTGKIKFNPLTREALLKVSPSSRYVIGRVTDEMLEDINYDLERHRESLEYGLEAVFGACVNKIFVM